MPDKLTKKLIESTSYIGDGKEKYIRWDTEISGFGVRLYPSGKKSFILSYRQDGTKRLYTIGQYGNITLEQARELARKKMGEVADGKDPLLVRKARKKKNEWTVEKAFKDFLKKYAQTYTKTWRETERIFEKDVLPAIGRKPPGYQMRICPLAMCRGDLLSIGDLLVTFERLVLEENLETLGFNGAR